jgi:AcrR family transcriptional regulator
MVTAGPAHFAARQQQERRVVDAVRQLLDDGAADPSIDEISRTGRMSKAIIYRHVASKEELYLLALCSYQEELVELLRRAPVDQDPLTRLDSYADTYIDFCLRYPAYLDCTIGLLRHTWHHLSQQISTALENRVMTLIAEANAMLTDLLIAGRDAGVFDLPPIDLNLITHLTYTCTIGVMHGLRSESGVRRGAGGQAERFPLDKDAALTLLRVGLYRMYGVAVPTDANN